MTKTIFKTLLSLLILFSISCGDRPTGSDGGGIIGDNKETPQTETQASKDFLNNFNSLAPQYTGKIEEVYDSQWNSKEYIFEANADMTVEGTKYTFWGMAPDNKEYAYYYNGSAPYTFPLTFKSGSLVEITEETEISKVRNVIFNNSSGGLPTVNTPTDTSGDGAWKSQVANKTFTSKSMTTYNYTFELGGNIKETTGSGSPYEETKTYYFWGALDNNRVVYYKIDSINGKDYWKYCGFSFDIAKQEISKYDEYSAAYRNSYNNWSQSQNQNNINWSSYPLPTTKDIDWNQPTTGTLTTK